jgi:hypothetical protein
MARFFLEDPPLIKAPTTICTTPVSPNLQRDCSFQRTTTLFCNTLTWLSEQRPTPGFIYNCSRIKTGLLEGNIENTNTNRPLTVAHHYRAMTASTINRLHAFIFASLTLASSALAGVYITNPVANTTAQPGELLTIRWGTYLSNPTRDAD